MKIYLFLLCFIFQISFAQSAFETGNKLYQNEDYQGAANAYESVLSSGKQSAEVYFNLANCYYKLHKIAPAIYNFEKAQQLNPNDDEIKTNLSFAKKMTLDTFEEIPEVGFNKLIHNFTSTVKYDNWAWLAVVFAFLFLGCFIGYYFSGFAYYKRIFFTGMFAMLLFLLISVFSGINEKNYLSSEKPAIVFAEKTALKGEPKASSPDKLQLHEGTKVLILESNANWKKVQLPDETTGWIDQSAMKVY